MPENLKDSTMTDGASKCGKGESVLQMPSVITSDFPEPSAITRIAEGSAFKVKGRRMMLNGDIQYLIEL